ncbi:hypothetical protein BCE75_102440 [Isoptericola sp. CG 20/1183]|uniref:Uncharacterized protein n=1 Tax=Isoptericola halotolerans TaxID=300560 RepID=A0ABX5EJA9_9MICO|nr:MULTISPECIES: hypothetical protein [Isoptericola]MCK0118056.1 hypothetical protein [Isoptericola sp. S6320L]PRZ09726.1 hypothetical protein BCE75_102440 [Isoptericola sp. CG 20/1183]PRZ10527.1 hypothetical protein BCL65_101672 [Isoptericola halotolerans]
MANKKDTDARAGQAMRPASYALGAAVVICVLGVVANVAAPSAFAAVGGWVTVVVVLLLVSVWAGLSMVRRTNQNVARMEDDSSTGA